MSRPRRLLAVSHETTLTGAPINLTHLLRWIVDHTDVEVHSLLLRNGPLVGRFKEISPFTLADWRASSHLLDRLPPRSPKLVDDAHQRLTGAWIRRQFRHLDGCDLVYLNGIPSVATLPFLPHDGPVVAHVHEMGLALSELPAAPTELLRRRPDRWIAASHPVRDDLVSIVGVPADGITVQHEFIDARSLAERPPHPREVQRVRRAAGIADDCTVVMGSGRIGWRKGPDLFVELAASVARRTRGPIRFVWLGGTDDDVLRSRIEADARRAGVTDLVRFVGDQDDPWPWFAAADVFVLTSREDPFPLVCLEHAALGVPTVTFRNGGAVELLEAAGPAAAAGIVDHLDVAGMTDRVLALLDDEALHRAAAAQLRARVLSEHDVTVGAPRLFAEIEELLS